MNQKLSRWGGYVGLAYAVLCYAIFLAVFSYFILFTTGLFVPKTVNNGASVSVLSALIIDCALLLLFGVQHTIMARPSFKERWMKLVPPAAERSTYVLIASLCLGLLMLGWVPLPGALWRTDNALSVALLWSVCAGGWALLLVSTFLIDHFELFGLKQGWLRARRAERVESEFKTPALYRVVRHPMMLGFLLGFWATPHMTTSHLALSIGMTLYILVGIAFEERDLVRRFGAGYLQYQRTVPKLLPGFRARSERRDRAPKGVIEASDH
jgi:protein-S-isoprenylcysteine O-methyltransferase Ste14